MRNFFLAIVFCILNAVTVYAASGDSPKCEDNPLFNRFPGERLSKCEHNRFSELAMKRWKNPAKPNAGVDNFKVEGEYWYNHNIIDKDASGKPASYLEVVRNIEHAVKETNGTILYSNNKQVFYRILRGDGEYWGESGCGGGNGTNCSSMLHKIVKTAAVQQSLVVTSDQIAKSVGDEGKVVFYGIYFDTDKATLKKESAPTIAEIAKWLNNNPKTKVYIVGHTDMQGNKEHNMELSRNRAAAVVEELTSKHGISTTRLIPEGVGPLAPVSSNKTDAGRGKNRRVEMVLH